MLSLHSLWTEHWKAIVLGTGSLVTFFWIRREVSKPWAPLWAEWVLAQILWQDGIRRIFVPSAEDGTLSLSFWERFRRVAELRAILALERFHQIDAARRTANGENGWGKTTGTHHMQHLPGLVFRGEDQDIVREALQRGARIFQDATEAFPLTPGLGKDANSEGSSPRWWRPLPCERSANARNGALAWSARDAGDA